MVITVPKLSAKYEKGWNDTTLAVDKTALSTDLSTDPVDNRPVILAFGPATRPE